MGLGFACANLSTLGRYRRGALENTRVNPDGLLVNTSDDALNPARGRKYCDTLVSGQTVSWIPATPITMRYIPEHVEKRWRESASLEIGRRVVLLKYTDQAGVEKRGYTLRINLRSLDEADEPSK